MIRIRDVTCDAKIGHKHAYYTRYEVLQHGDGAIL